LESKKLKNGRVAIRSELENFDVVVVGYGPVGQALTGLLARLGYKTLAFERHPSLYGRPRAGHMDGEVMRIMQSAGVAARLELLMRPIRSYELVSADGEILQTVEIGQSGSGWKASYLFHQPELEEVLDANARSQGGNVALGWAVTAIEEDDQGVTVVATQGEGTTNPTENQRTVRARYVVGCDGANSFVRRVMGVENKDFGFEPYEFLVMDFEQSNPDRELSAMGEVRQVLDPKRPTTAGRWNGNRWSRWEFMRFPGETREQMESEDNCWRLLAPWGVTRADGHIVRRTVYTFQARSAERWRSGRLLLAGDAAHTMPPFMAQGLCAGMRDVSNLGWKLDMVLSGSASEVLLDTYEVERKPHVTQITEMAMEIGRLVTITDPGEAKKRDDTLRSRKGEKPHGLPQLQTGLLLTNGVDTHELVGRQSLQARVHRKGKTGLLDDLTGRCWRLVSRHPIPAHVCEKYASLFSVLNLQLAHVTRGALDASYIDLDAEYAGWFKAHDIEAYIERPDFQIVGVARKINEVEDLLSSLMRAGREAGVQINEISAEK
jgi:3-(3-hydroxy-phenyl)propionate hydroxylase